MKGATLVVVLMVFSVAVLLPFSLIAQPVSAQENNYTIQRVDHEVELMYSGQMIIRDTISVSGQSPGDFLIGFPYKYGSYVLKGVAYDDNDNVFPVSLGVQLADRSGFYGARISFPQGAPKVFTVVFVLSNSRLSLDLSEDVYTLDFPAYPSFVKDAAQCHVDIVLPETPTTITVTKEDGEVSTTAFVKQNLPAFTYSPALANFSLPSGSLRIVNFKTLDRQITINPAGAISVSDRYRITNKSPETLGSLEIGLPLDASNLLVRDEFGRILTTDILTDSGNTLLANVTFISSVDTSESTLLTAEYNLLDVSEKIPNFNLNLNLFPDFNYYVEKATVTVVPPEGARFLTPELSSIGSSSSLVRRTFQETLSVSKAGVSKVDNAAPFEEALHIAYAYNPLWLSFRPTLWTWTLAVVGCIVVAVWRRPKASASRRISAPSVSIVLSPDLVRAFTDAYEEKTRIASELKTLEARAQKGKLPRRRYKVQKRSLEVRLDNITRNISESKKTFRSAGGVYASLVRQLDIAETELVEVETGIRTVNVRHRRGELPLEAYKKSLASFERRREKAEASINGILLRIREEIR